MISAKQLEYNSHSTQGLSVKWTQSDHKSIKKQRNEMLMGNPAEEWFW
jgi:hypothetical protein